jgi:hypothetical protein
LCPGSSFNNSEITGCGNVITSAAEAELELRFLRHG